VAFGGIWQNGKYSYGVWQWFAYNSEILEKRPKIEKCKQFSPATGFGPKPYTKMFYQPKLCPALRDLVDIATYTRKYLPDSVRLLLDFSCFQAPGFLYRLRAPEVALAHELENTTVSVALWMLRLSLLVRCCWLSELAHFFWPGDLGNLRFSIFIGVGGPGHVSAKPGKSMFQLYPTKCLFMRGLCWIAPATTNVHIYIQTTRRGRSW
jgi:hypothetical protein